MPLTELMNYFNDQLQAHARTRALPKTGFFKADNSYWGRFGNLILGSKFQPIHTFADDNLIGYNSDLLVRSATGNSLNIDSIFNSLDSTDQIIHLDRLVRTLHSLNYLQQFDGRKDLLSLHVQPRHIISVVSEHGKTFEKILSDCGLGPERVLLHTRLLDKATLPHFRQALASYRQRGYKIGIQLSDVRELELLLDLGLIPDIIFADHPALTAQLADTPLPAAFDPSLRILVAKKPGLDAHTGSRLHGYLFNTDDNPLLPQAAIS
ncbi:MAG TPA: hypothetical protein VLC79_04745 [Cellvibrio sp.]|nr:hypothetical protein [Cellvibrio sp.]